MSPSPRVIPALCVNFYREESLTVDSENCLKDWLHSSLLAERLINMKSMVVLFIGLVVFWIIVHNVTFISEVVQFQKRLMMPRKQKDLGRSVAVCGHGHTFTSPAY